MLAIVNALRLVFVFQTFYICTSQTKKKTGFNKQLGGSLKIGTFAGRSGAACNLSTQETEAGGFP